MGTTAVGLHVIWRRNAGRRLATFRQRPKRSATSGNAVHALFMHGRDALLDCPAMNASTDTERLSRDDLELILSVTRALAAPFELLALLKEITSAAQRVLQAERVSVWLHDADAGELVVRVANDIRDIRISVGTGLVGACARDRALINVPDCYADPRFDPSTDRRTGFRTRCSLTLPLIDHQEALVGVMQVINSKDGVFDAADEALAQALAAQCAIALSRVRMTEAVIEGERLRKELELARVVQMSSLPSSMPQVSGYDLHGEFLPAEATGGDTFDLALTDRGLLVVVGDATGHGIAPALAVTQMHAMLRMAFRLGADLETAFRQVNDQLARTLPDGRFVTAFIGLLDPGLHRLRFLSGGQGPILHFRANDGSIMSYRATSFPMGAMPLSTLRPPVEFEMAPGDILAVLSDGIYEYENPDGTQFGRQRVEAVLRESPSQPTVALCERMLSAVRGFARGRPQEDDITAVFVKRREDG
jgi:phosphoserine phosphatase